MKPLSETANEARAKASELAEKTAENARATAEAAKARIQDGYGRARAATSDLAARASEQADAAREVAGEAYAKGKAQAKRVRSYFADPKNKEKTSASNRKFISDTYIEIARSCKRSLNETSFNAAKAKLAEKRGVARINSRFDYWTKFFNGSFEQFVKEIINAN